jgi:hypothetical protein
LPAVLRPVLRADPSGAAAGRTVLCSSTFAVRAVAMCPGTVLFSMRSCPDDLGSTLPAGMRADALIVWL